MNSIEYYQQLQLREQERENQNNLANKKIAESIANKKVSDMNQKEFEIHQTMQSSNRFQ